MEQIYNQMNQGLEGINLAIKEEIDRCFERIKKKMESAKKEIKKSIDEEKKCLNKIMNIKHLPNRQFLVQNPDPNFNYFINLILFILVNLKIITKFIYREETNTIKLRINNNNGDKFIIFFNYIMEQMRHKEVLIPNYQHIHEYFRNTLNNKYMSQDPSYLINFILKQVEKNIDQVKNNDIKNIITDNFSLNLITKEKCNVCGRGEDQIKKREKKLIIDLFLKKPDIDIKEELDSIFKNSLRTLEEENYRSNCECGYHKIISKSIENPKKYLILNLDRNADPENHMKLTCPYLLNLKEEDDGKEYQYKLILSLANININSDYKKNMNDFVLIFKNFINNRWYKTTLGKDEDMSEFIKNETKKKNISKDMVIQKIVSGLNPAILIYKKI